MSIRMKLLLGFSALLALTICLAGQAIWAVKLTGDLVTAVYDEPLMGISQARAALASFQEARAEVFSGKLRPGSSGSQARLGAIFDDINGALGVVKERVKMAAVQTQAERAKQAVDGWNKSMTALLVSSPKGETSLPTPQALERQSAAVASTLDDLAEQVAAAGYEMRSKSEETIRSTRTALLVNISLAVLVGIGLSLFIARQITKPMKALSAAMRDLAGGNREVEVPGIERTDDYAPMAAAVQMFKDAAIVKHRLEAEAAQSHEVTEQRLQDVEAAHREAGDAQRSMLEVLASALERLARRDLTTRIDAAVSDDYRKLKDDFNAALEQLEQAIDSVQSSTFAIKSGSQEVASSASDLSVRAEQQAASLEEAAAALSDVTETVGKTASGSTHAHNVVSIATSDAEEGEKIVRQAIAAMGGIEKSSEQIGRIIGVIDEIAFQTNLLALNAGVEAARAGEAGRGFAVVASEVRALAQRSAEAAKEIRNLISSSKGQVNDGVSLVTRTGEALERMQSRVAEINAAVSTIAETAKEQSARLAEINSAVGSMDAATQRNAAAAEESTAASMTLADQAGQLAALVGSFKLSSNEARRPGVKELSDRLEQAYPGKASEAGPDRARPRAMARRA